MTREERHIAVLNRMLENMNVFDSIKPTEERKRAIKEAIEALEQEPYYDAISYDAVIKVVDAHTNEDGALDDDISVILEDLPPVKPQEPKTGHWIKTRGDLNAVYSCSECGSKIISYNICECKFCFNCEAKMKSEE